MSNECLVKNSTTLIFKLQNIFHYFLWIHSGHLESVTEEYSTGSTTLPIRQLKTDANNPR